MPEITSTAPSTHQDSNWTVQEAYNIYNGANDGEGLARFIDVAEAVLETNISPLDRIRLLALLGTAVADPRETADFYTQAESQWQVAKLYQNLMQGETEAKMHDLRVLIDQLGDVVHREHQAANRSEGEEDNESDEDEEFDTAEQLGVSAKPIPSRSTSVEPPSNELDIDSRRPMTSTTPEQKLAIRPSKGRGSVDSEVR